MVWWKRLKAWQKGAIASGAIHFLLSLLLIQGRTEGGGLILVEVALESPWLLLLYLFGVKSPANLLSYAYLPLVVGTVFYGLLGGAVWQVIGRLRAKGQGR